MADQSPLQEAITRLSNRLTSQAQTNAEHIDALAERVESALVRIESRLTGRIEQMDKDAQRELAEARRDIGELRDKLHQVETKADEAATASRAGTVAAVGAMRTSTEVAAAAPKAAAALFWHSATGRLVKWGSGIAAFGAAVTALPQIARFLWRIGEALFQALVSNPPPPIPPGAMG